MGLEVGVTMLAAAVALLAWWEFVKRRSPLDPLPTLLPSPPPLGTGPFARNARLHSLSRVGEGLLPHPEDLALLPAAAGAAQEEPELFAACEDGWIKRIRLADGAVFNWTKIEGRPLGIVAGLHGELLVCEPTLGLLNVTQGQVVTLTNNACGVQFKFADGLDVAKDGTIYFTDASTKFGYGQSDWDVLEGRPHGRLLQYDPRTQSTTVLVSDLYFANGVAISPIDQSFVVFCETAKVRCQRYWLQGPKKGTFEIFIDNLPGYPDNIRSTSRGTFWISLVSGRSVGMEMMLGMTFVKHIMAVTKGALNKALDAAYHTAKVLEVDSNGKPLRYLEDPTGDAIAFVTTALEIGDFLYLGGLVSDYIGKVKLN